MDNAEKHTGIFKGFAVCVMLFCLAAGYSGYIYMFLFAFAAGCDFYGKIGAGEKPTALISKNILGIYLRYWPVLIIAVITAFVLKKPTAEHFVADSIYCFLGLHFSFCLEWRFIPAFVLILAAAPVLLRITDRKNASLPADILFIVLFFAFTWCLLPKIMNTGLLSALNASLLWKSIFTALKLLPAFALGCLQAKYCVPEWRERFKAAAWLGKVFRYSGSAWLSIWLIASFLSALLENTAFALRLAVLLFGSIMLAGLLEAAERKLRILFNNKSISF